MKIVFLGSCSGTEPMPGRKHCSFVIESGEKVYFFDAGEGCSYTAHNMGIDVMAVEHIVISHPHMDHVGGLGNLLWTIRKLVGLSKAPLGHDVYVHTPAMQTFDGVMAVLNQSEGNYTCDYKTIGLPVRAGEVFLDGVMRVTARPNTHMAPSADGTPLSYSFLIECEGKRILYTGDIGHVSEVADWLSCDFMIMESGHHLPETVCAWIRQNGVIPRQIWFNHHGRAMLANPQKEIQKARVALGAPQVYYSSDMQSVEL